MTRSDRRICALRGALALLAFLLISCRSGPEKNEAQALRVRQTFESCRAALLNNQADAATSFFPKNVDEYLNKLNTAAPVASASDAANSAPSNLPVVDLFLRTALEKKVPADLRAHLTLGVLLQRMTDEKLLKTRDVEQLSLGEVTIHGEHASAPVYNHGYLTALQLPFVKEDGTWKIDIMAVLPDAELLMRLDRAIKGETPDTQVDGLVSKLPSL